MYLLGIGFDRFDSYSFFLGFRVGVDRYVVVVVFLGVGES